MFFMSTLIHVYWGVVTHVCISELTGSSLVQVMPWCRTGTKPLPEPMMLYHQLDLLEQTWGEQTIMLNLMKRYFQKVLSLNWQSCYREHRHFLCSMDIPWQGDSLMTGAFPYSTKPWLLPTWGSPKRHKVSPESSPRLSPSSCMLRD